MSRNKAAGPARRAGVTDQGRAALIGLWLLSGVGVVLLGGLWLLLPEPAMRQAPRLVNLWLAVQHDIPWLLALAGLVPSVVMLPRYPRVCAVLDGLRDRAGAVPPGVLVAGLAATAGGVAALGVPLVYHRFTLSLDEVLLVWQAKTFLSGSLLAPLPDVGTAVAEALQPIFMRHDPVNDLWLPGYRPLSSALYALFGLVGLGAWSNAVLVAVCVALTAAVARRIWPDAPMAPVLAAVLLAASPQLLVTGMTSYAMTGHLALNLLWLWLFLADTRRGYLLAALVGALACGLHQVHIHPVFILPFMLALLWQRRWRLAAGYAVWYAAVLLVWVFWQDIATWLVTGGQGVAAGERAGGADFFRRAIDLVGGWNAASAVFTLVNWVRFVAWQSPLAVLLALAGLAAAGAAPRPVRLLMAGLALTALTHAVMMPGQGHGWGYRYLHVHLGSLALIGTWGALSLRDRLPAVRRAALLRIGSGLLLVGVLVGVPLRALQTEAFVRPFAAADQAIKAIDADLVVIDDRAIWFGVDLVRNDPLLRNRPRVLSLSHADPAVMRAVCPGRTVALLTHADVAPFGLRSIPDAAPGPEPATRLAEAGCRLIPAWGGDP